jgi:hypothetical protein
MEALVSYLITINLNGKGSEDKQVHNKRQMTGFCEHGYEPLECIKPDKFLLSQIITNRLTMTTNLV